MGKTDKSRALYARAQEVIPGGVNSPARAFGAVGMEPLFLERAEGARVTDADGNQYIDFIGSWGPMILGHARAEVLAAAGEAAAKGMSFGAATELEVQMAELVRALVPSMELTRMVNSGTEATMSALRAARGFTGRDKIIKFSGCYHGHVDALLVKAGSGLLAGASPDSAGVSAACAADTSPSSPHSPRAPTSAYAAAPISSASASQENTASPAALEASDFQVSVICLPPVEPFVKRESLARWDTTIPQNWRLSSGNFEKTWD